MAVNNFTSTIQQLDDVGATLARATVTVSDVDPTVGELRAGYLVDTNEATISLPFTQIRQFQLKNTHASAKITVKWTPTTGASATILILGPGDVVAFWHSVTGATYGFSQLKLTSDTAAATYSLYLGG
jgi:hypothetical protein